MSLLNEVGESYGVVYLVSWRGVDDKNNRPYANYANANNFYYIINLIRPLT